MYTDPIADMLTRIRNAGTAGHQMVEMPSSKQKVELAKVLKAEGYIVDYKVKEDGKFKVLAIEVKYESESQPIIRKIQRISKPGLRVYKKAKNIEKILGGLGVAILSTNKGLLTDRKARKENIGGEVLCYVY
ncbi:MAG: 30S ribosomal protein S8 [Candidatus Melainabacteria bacterium GWF2_37_15]|nr:MAG: 30S ribosomal protein S8 [Candidatus Melainabacteria bacterium GWF2_37_15]